MPGDYFHGVETEYVNDGGNVIEVVAASVIGLVGTAPAAVVAAPSKLTLGDGESQLKFTAVETGSRGDGISVELNEPDEANAELSVSVVDSAISVNLASDLDGVITSTASDVAAAINGNADAAALVAVESAGNGVVAYSYTTYLSGGVAEAYPLNKPILITGNAQKAIQNAGVGGTLGNALADIYRQSGASVVVVRVEQGKDDAETKSNVIDGLQVIKGSEGIVGTRPRLLIAPEFSHLSSVGEQLETVAKSMNAIAIIDSDTYAEFNAIVKRRKRFDEAYMVHGGVDIYDTDKNADIKRHASATVAGHIVRVDNDEGYYNSPSNRKIYDIDGTAIDIDYMSSGDGKMSCLANQLNAQNITTIVPQDGGFNLWGNRLANGTMLAHQRIRYIVGDSINKAYQSYVDRNITRNLVDSVIADVTAFLRRLETNGVISGGSVWVDKDQNIAEIGNAHSYFDYDLGFFDINERMTFRQHVNNSYNEQIFS